MTSSVLSSLKWGGSLTKIYNLALANIRKEKGQAVSLLIFVIIAAVLLNLGLLLTLRFGDFFDQKFEETNSAHFSIMVDDANDQEQNDEYLKYIQNYKGVTETEDREILFLIGYIDYNNGKWSEGFIFENPDNPQKMNPFKLMEGKAPQNEDEICLPYVFTAGGGYKTGDSCIITNKGTMYSFRISGFTEEIMFGEGGNGLLRTYLSSSGYEKMLSGDLSSKCRLLTARMENPSDGDTLSIDFSKENVYKSPAGGGGLSYSSIKMARTFTSDRIAMMLVVFAVLIVVINLIVIWFRIRNGVEEGITNIGALKAMGYTSSQIIGGINLQFGATSTLGTVIGIALSYLALPAVSFVLEQQTALIWAQEFDLSISLMTMLALLVSVLIITLLTAKNIKKINPIIALRQGLSSHSFKRNNLPLDTSKGPLSLLIALKSALQSKGQMVMLFIIIFAVSFTAAAGVAFYDSLGLHPEKYLRSIGGEIADCAFFLNDSKDSRDVMDRIKSKSIARKAIYFDDTTATVMIDDVTLSSIITDDFSLLEGSLLYQGQYPKYDNEIVIGTNFSDYSGKNIDDTVRVLLGGKTEDFIVVGLVQSTNNTGCMMTADGIRRLDPAFEHNIIYVYLHDSTKATDFIKEIERESGNVFRATVNAYELIDALRGTYASVFGMAAAIIMVVTIFVIILVLYLVLKTVITRRKRALGIQKALGFTTWQLMNQLSLTYIPVIALGVVAGGIVEALAFNSLFAALMGIRSISMPTPVGMTIVLCIGLIFVSYAISLLISWRIRKISAYELMSE